MHISEFFDIHNSAETRQCLAKGVSGTTIIHALTCMLHSCTVQVNTTEITATMSHHRVPVIDHKLDGDTLYIRFL